MPKSKMTAAGLADVCARLINRESQTSILKRTGMGLSTITRIIAALQKHGLAMDVFVAPRFDPKRDARLHELFETSTMSNRQIVRETGISLSTVNKSRERYNVALIQAGGELPRCECGEYLHHPRLCWARHRQNMKNAGISAVVMLSPEMTDDVRQRLLRGETMRSIAERVSLKKEQIHSFLRTFTLEQRQQREAAFRTSAGQKRSNALARKIARPMATNPAADPLYARISAAVPRSIDPSLRDDMISQAYLEVLEGRLKEDAFLQGIRRVKGQMFRAFANPWGNLSLDAMVGDDGGRSMIDRVPADISAFA